MYEPYPVPELARDHKNVRYSSLWTFAKQDLRLLIFFLVIAGFIGLGIEQFWICIFIGFLAFFATQMRSLYLVNDWIANRPYDVPPICMAFGGLYYLMSTARSVRNVLSRPKWSG